MSNKWVVRGSKSGKVKWFEDLSHDNAMAWRDRLNRQGYDIVAVMRDNRK